MIRERQRRNYYDAGYAVHASPWVGGSQEDLQILIFIFFLHFSNFSHECM